jgi:hypothetical protein
MNAHQKLCLRVREEEKAIRGHRDSIREFLDDFFKVGSLWGWMKTPTHKTPSTGTVAEYQCSLSDGMILMCHETKDWRDEVKTSYKRVRWDKLLPVPQSEPVSK